MSEAASVSDYITNNGDPTYKTAVRVKNLPPAKVDVAIIGAGLGGLMAAAQLGKAGKTVAVFDQHYVAGGCCTQFSRGGPKARYNFDVGLHYIGDCEPGGAIPAVLEEVGVALVPGSAFGAEGYMRISFATSMANLEDAVSRIKQVFEK